MRERDGLCFSAFWGIGLLGEKGRWMHACMHLRRFVDLETRRKERWVEIDVEHESILLLREPALAIAVFYTAIYLQ